MTKSEIEAVKANGIKIAPGYELPSSDVSCLDAAEMLVDGFIRDVGIFSDKQDRNELVRRVGTLLSMQREVLKQEMLADRERLIEALKPFGIPD